MERTEKHREAESEIMGSASATRPAERHRRTTTPTTPDSDEDRLRARQAKLRAGFASSVFIARGAVRSAVVSLLHSAALELCLWARRVDDGAMVDATPADEARAAASEAPIVGRRHKAPRNAAASADSAARDRPKRQR
jgi:hypothetical protein